MEAATFREPAASMADAALELLALGPVFPLHEPRGEGCSCANAECSSPAKHPRTREGCREASSDPERVAAWWARWPSANVGLATGRLVVLDVDGPTGRATLEQLEASRGPLPVTLTVATGNGEHRYFAAPEGVSIGNAAGARGRGLGAGLDVRGEGGYVVAPPSVHANGTRYTFENLNVPVAPLPAWIVEQLTTDPDARPADAPPLRVVPPPSPASTRERSYAEAALRGECEAVRTAPEGSRNEQLNASAYSLGQLVAGGLLDEGTVREQLEAAALAAGLAASETAKTLASGLDAGKRNPRTVPDPSPRVPRATAPGAPAKAGPDARPVVIVGARALEDMTADALEAVHKGNAPERVFVREGRLCRVVHDERGRAVVENLGEDALRGELARFAAFCRPTKDGELKPAAPPLDVVRDLRALGCWPSVPALEALVESPVMRRDGSILRTRGYDGPSRLYYSPGGPLDLPAIPDRPSAEEAAAALAVLGEPLAEFPFASPADRANALALMLTPLVRPMVAGNVPLALVEAPRAGTGKGLLADVAAILATGRPAELTDTPRHADEVGKVIGALLMEGASMVVLDEAEQLGSPALNMALTSASLRVRVLGRSQTARVPQRATWIALGNNPRIRGDMVRRFYRVRLDAKVSVPWARTFERGNLREWTAHNRGRLVAAALTVARAWHVAGRPGKPEQRLGGFEDWTLTVGGMLAYAGEAAFLANVVDAQHEADAESAALEAFLEALEDRYGTGGPFTVAEACEALEAAGPLREALPDELAALPAERLRDALGKTFRKARDTRYGTRGVRLEQAGMTRAKVARWRIVADEPREAEAA